MTLNEYIIGLEKLAKEYGELEVITSIDEEGNGFTPVYYGASAGNFEDGEFNSKNDWEAFDEEVREINAVCVN